METKNIKIVFLCRNLGKVNRGVEAHVQELAIRLNKKFDVEIFTGKDSDSLKKIINGKFNLVIPTNGRLQALKVSIGRILGGYKTLIAAHAGIGRDEIFNLFTLPNIYVALTQFQLNWAGKFALLSKLVKIPNGIDLEKFNPTGKQKEFNLERPIVLSVGALEWYKHHDLAIEAVSQIKKGSLLIVGEGSEEQNLKNQGEKLLGKSRFKIIKAAYHEMPEIYRSVDLFTLPSWDREAFGIVYLEAMASGLGIVAPDDSSRREIVGNAGVLINVFNPEEYGKAIQKALDTDWENVSRKQAEKFSWEKVSKEYEELIIKTCL